MIRKLKLKFICLAMISLSALLLVIVAGMNIINYSTVVTEADSTLSLLSQNKGTFPDFDKGPNIQLPHGMSQELPYESRYFSALLNASGEVVSIETSRIASVDETKATEYALKALRKRPARGFIGNFRYVRYSELDGQRIVFLDCGRKLDSFYTFLYASVGMSVAGLIVIFFVIFFFSGKILHPVIESYQKQRQFITDAGHEIKTPLTIIRANADLLEMELSENECLADIQQQTKRLLSLTNDLVTLTRMEESEQAMLKIDLPISEVVTETAIPFRALAIQQGKELICNIQPLLTLKGDHKAIEQLVSILMDNALKYSPQGSTIRLDLVKQNRTIYLSVFNTTETDIHPDQLRHVFDRFYRTDASRNSETGGHGIGLSIAQAIATAHGGRIQACTRDGHSFQIWAVFPI